MNEYELIEVSISVVAGGMTAVSIYLTVVSAFLIAAFMAGDRLTKGQAIITIGLFVSGAIFATYGTVEHFLTLENFQQRLVEIGGSTTKMSGAVTAIALGTLQTLGIMGSLKFLWDVRHPKKE